LGLALTVSDQCSGQQVTTLLSRDPATQVAVDDPAAVGGLLFACGG
jgi:hypothetical protein